MRADQFILDDAQYRALELDPEHRLAPFRLVVQALQDPLQIRGRVECGGEGDALVVVVLASRRQERLGEECCVALNGEGPKQEEEGAQERSGDQVAVPVERVTFSSFSQRSLTGRMRRTNLSRCTRCKMLAVTREATCGSPKTECRKRSSPRSLHSRESVSCEYMSAGAHDSIVKTHQMESNSAEERTYVRSR